MHTIPIKFFDAAAIICCKILRYLLIITITKKKNLELSIVNHLKKNNYPNNKIIPNYRCFLILQLPLVQFEEKNKKSIEKAKSLPKPTVSFHFIYSH